jgi:hypothetical protein
MSSRLIGQRRHVAEGVSEGDDRTTVSVLERMVGNLQAFLGRASNAA